MNEANFCSGFFFHIFRFHKYHFTDNSRTPLPRHYFGCLLSGTAVIKAEHTELALKPGEIFYLPKGLKYQSHWFGNPENEIAFYSFGFDIAPTRSVYDLQKVPDTAEIKAMFAELCREIPFTEKGIGKLYRLFGEAAERMQPAQMPWGNPVVEKATRYIFRHPSARISQVAAHCNISESGLYALFRKHTGQTPNDIRLQALCDRAVTLLSTTNRSVQDISDTVGFSSPSYFRKVLRKHTGKTPLEIRKEAAF